MSTRDKEVVVVSRAGANLGSGEVHLHVFGASKARHLIPHNSFGFYGSKTTIERDQRIANNGEPFA